MRNIDKFILHVVHNWKNELNEAYSENAIKGFIKKFQEEADDLNIQITDNQLRAYITDFDRIKEKLPSDQRDLNKWSVAKFIRLVTASKGVEKPKEEVDITPDVVYHNEDNSIIIYNGSKEKNCISYGGGEKWCITRSSFPNYRYSETRSFPTFYLAKNNNLSSSNKLSFVAIQVRDPKTTYDGNRYVYTNRDNSPHESHPMSFEELLNEVPWLRNISDIKSILKYIPISSEEKLTQQYKRSAISYREWIKFPFSVKQQYLVVRSNNKLFSDINDNDFVEKYLPKYPELAKFVAETPGVVDSITLLKNLDKFPNQIRRSITANLQNKIKIEYISQETLPFDVKKLLVQLDKWNLKSNERIYITKDNQAIVLLTLGDDIKIGLYTEEDDFPNIKLNKRTSKYLLDYPELDKIPFRNLLKLVQDEIIDKGLINNVLNKAKEDPNSAIIVKKTEDGDIILDSNSFSSYKIEPGGKIISVPFDDEGVQQVFASAKDNEGFQQNALNIFKTKNDIPRIIDKKALVSIINSIPYSQRKIPSDNANTSDILLATTDENFPFFIMGDDFSPGRIRLYPVAIYDRNGSLRTPSNYTDAMASSYFTYLRQINKSFSDDELQLILRSSANEDDKKVFIRNNPPVNTNNVFKAIIINNIIYLINSRNSGESFKVSDTGKLVKAKISKKAADQLLGRILPAPAAGAAAPAAAPAVAPADGAPRRGRPPGVPNTPRPQQQDNTPPAEGSVGLGNILQRIGASPTMTASPALQRWPRNWLPMMTAGNRGASRRQNILGNAGRVIQAFKNGQSSIYIIRLNNNTIIADIAIYSGGANKYFLIIQNTLVRLDSPSNLLRVLQQRNLAEVHHYIVNEYFDRNPKHISEFKQLLRKHINEKNNQTMTRSKLKEVIRQLVDKVLAEAETAPSKPKEKPGPAVAPGKPDTGKPKPRRPLGNPTTAPKIAPKAEGKKLNEEEMLQKIVARFKSGK